MTTFTAAEKLACIDRELRLREKLYPRWIENGRIKEDKAAREIAVLSEIRDDYAKAVAVAADPDWVEQYKDYAATGTPI